MSEFEDLLPQLLNLKHFELQVVTVNNDLADGHRWRIVTRSLLTFRFKIRIDSRSESAIESFQTPFWLKEKRWYVAYQSGWIYTVPFLPSLEATSSRHPPMIPTLDDAITNFTLDSDRPDRLNHVKTLTLRVPLPADRVMTIVNLDSVERLILPTWTTLSLFAALLPLATHLTRVSMHGQFASAVIQSVGEQTFEQIRALDLTFCYSAEIQISVKLSRIFPRVTYLNIASIESMMHIVHLVDCFRYLSNGVFGISSLYTKNRQSDQEQIQSQINTKRASNNETFRCQILSPSTHNLLSYVYIWTSKPIRIL